MRLYSERGTFLTKPNNVRWRNLKLKTIWLLLGFMPGFMGTMLGVTPAMAARLESWRFDRNLNRLEFKTDVTIRPRAQLIQNPTRVVVDLPGIKLNKPLVNQPIGGAIKGMRVSQFDPQTTRIVIEMALGYNLDPQLIQIRGVSNVQWSVQLPKPQLNPATPPIIPTEKEPTPISLPSPVPGISKPSPASPQSTIQSIEIEPNSGQLIIRGDQALTYGTRWQGSEYHIILNNARLADNVTGPQLAPSSPVTRLRLRQDDLQTVTIMVEPSSGTRIGDLILIDAKTLALSLRRSLVPIGQPGGSSPGIPIPVTPHAKFVVVIDAGHGGPDPGAIGIGGVREKDVVLSISQQVAALLQQQGIEVVMTRNDDSDVDLEPRVQLAEQVNATLFVSIHANAFRMDRPDINGLETFYYSTGDGLAQMVHRTILQNVKIGDRGVRTARFYVLRETSMPSILIETGYLTGQNDAPLLATDNFRTQMANAIARGIVLYLGSG